MDDVEQKALRHLSKVVFGQAYRLEVMWAVANSVDGIVNLTDIAGQLRLPVSNVQKPLSVLVDSGLLTELPQGDSRRKHLLRQPSSAWKWTEELCALARSTSTPLDQRSGQDRAIGSLAEHDNLRGRREVE